MISSNGVVIDPSKFDAVMTWDTPKDADDIRKLPGFTGHYCRFVKDYCQGVD